MIRLLGILIGLGFVVVAGWSLAWGVAAYVTEEHEESVEHRFHKEPRDIAYSFDGPFGKYDRRQLQRGFQVYKEVCASCHGLSFVAFRNLEDLGYGEEEIKAIADKWQTEVPSVDPKTGEASTRKALPADYFPSPYPNEVAARAANRNALPPDLSLITKARHGGPAYVASLLTGYANPPADLPKDSRPGEGLHYNPIFPNLNIAMPPPLRDGQVSYVDGTNPSVGQMATDVSAFLAWTAEPKLENRRAAGWATLIFLIFATVLSYLAYQNIWHGGASRRVRRTGPLDPANMAKSDEAKSDAGIAG
ncbi:MAG TPA: cytochrome c1 [Allosphingosinicella sp.]|jgi:ubiquinol-cytochrome c reductase cytochrome c1 subunit|nr:cytochrome c1 [Allosphingosinicella sp.]